MNLTLAERLLSASERRVAALRAFCAGHGLEEYAREHVCAREHFRGHPGVHGMEPCGKAAYGRASDGQWYCAWHLKDEEHRECVYRNYAESRRRIVAEEVRT